ncbi:MAG: glycyl-radical enzyme activating protein [Clostridiales bacterium]|nr:glycyl-radical enzyme activating protein [Clostridiales bacterium]
MAKGFVFDVQSFSVHDGPGIRTTVFMGGCSLKCLWCHNPEGMSAVPKLRYDSSLCIMCGECQNICDCHSISEAYHAVNRTVCSNCGKCTNVCPTDALSICGALMTEDEILTKLIRDMPFYGKNGGVTFSGGEPLLQADFICECMKKCKKLEITTAVDTCGNVPREDIDRVLPYTDFFLYDIKAVTEEIHIKGTGTSNKSILENCRYLSDIGIKLHVRIPLIGSFNADESEIRNISAFLSSLKTPPESVTMIPYHSLGREKYGMFGMNLPKNDGFHVSCDDIEHLKNIMRECGMPDSQK